MISREVARTLPVAEREIPGRAHNLRARYKPVRPRQQRSGRVDQPDLGDKRTRSEQRTTMI